MAEGDSPTIARRRVRLALRAARETAGLTQADVAEEMAWSLTKVARIEKGEVSISISDLRAALQLLGVRDKTRVSSLLADARIARAHVSKWGWWQRQPFRSLISDPLRRFIGYEAAASEIRSFAMLYVPGPLQTPEYGTALSSMWLEPDSNDAKAMTQAQLDVLVEARRRRQGALLSRLGSVRFFVVADESVFRRPVGGPAVFASQLRLLVHLSERGLTVLRMLPYDLPVPIANNGSFDLVAVDSSRADSEVMYRENGMVDEIVEDHADTARHRRRFEELWRAANDEKDTIEFIKGRIANLEVNRRGRPSG